MERGACSVWPGLTETTPLYTFGITMAAKSLLEQNPNPNEVEIRSYIKGNICRCTGYKKIVEAIVAAADGV